MNTPTGPRPLISHHRGGGETGIPFSLALYEAAVAQGAELIEFDVRVSHDGVLFCTHEELGPDGEVLADLDWASIEEIMGDAVPRYDALLRLANGKSICHIDLKATGYEAAAVTTAEAILDDVVAGAVFTTLEDSSVRLLRSSFPQYVTALSLGRSTDDANVVMTAWIRLREVFPFRRLVRSGANAVAANHWLLTPLLLWFCVRTKRDVMVWTVNDDTRLRKFLTRRGVDVLITDRPMRATELRRALGESGGR